jgi:4'-phosphopantetheinyl transferase
MSNKWNLVSDLPPLEADEVHLWRIDLADAAGLAGRYTSLLSVSEQADANRRRVGQVRDHFILGRACSRVLIGSALGMSSSKINIVKGISFNLAHSKDTLLIAFRRQGSVGVDVEYFDRSIDIMEVALANFTENESNSLAAIADPQARLTAFYSYWTRKEAVGKADGRGLLVPLASFDVSVESMNSHPVHVKDSPDQEGKLYFVSDLDLGDTMAGALALESSEARIRSLIFPLQSSW